MSTIISCSFRRASLTWRLRAVSTTRASRPWISLRPVAHFSPIFRPFALPIQRPFSTHTETDDSRPDIFYHLVKHHTRFAVSFLETPEEEAAVGWLPAQGEGGEAGLNDFKENPEFRKILHEAIRTGLERNADEIWSNGALQLGNGWMHIHDDRNIPPLGRIGDPDDIIATVLVEDGKIQPKTYQAMPAYRLCTADGITHLTPGLASVLKEMLLARVGTK